MVSEAAAPFTAVPASDLVGSGPAGNRNEVVTVMVELVDQPAGVVYAQSLNAAVAQAGGNRATLSKPVLDAATSAATSASRAQVTRIEAAQQAILPTLTAMASGGHILFRVKSAYNGISMLATRGQIAQIANLSGVKAVHVQNPKFLTAASSIDFLNTRSGWTQISGIAPNGLHGEGVKIAIIDTGLDYVHTNFGGPGTPAAYAATTDTAPVPNAYFPTAKIPGGFDFAGDSYSAGVQDIPHPDFNPMDSNGHGTGSASLVGGLGVDAAGTTYVGNYDLTVPLAGMKIAPGLAPGALLYPLRVFGTSGSTNLVVQAIDWAIDPNGDGTVSDHMDIISMSLGANSGYADDPDAVAASNAAAAGVIVASAAGNAGDNYYIVSSPSVGSGTLSVAATFNDAAGFFFNASTTVNSPPVIAGQNYKAIYGSPSPTVGPSGLTADIVWANPAIGTDGTTPLTNAADMPGKICMIDRGTFGFAVKVKLCQDAGAAAALVVNNVAGNPITMSLVGPPTSSLPAVMISLADGATIKAQLDGVTRTGVNITLSNDNGFVNQGVGPSDTMPSYSSRGPRLGDSALKPDLSAPAEVVGVAANGTGSNVMSFNGTSSATPHVAGMMGLLKQLHPTWSVEHLMALAMNTSTHNEFTGAGGTGNQYGVGRVGAGRIDVSTAILANVVAYNMTNPGLVNVSFGIVEVPVDSSITLNKTVALTNNGASDVTYNVTYVDATPLTGATFTVPGAPVLVTAGSTVPVTVTFSATGNLLKHAREASVALNLTSARHWLTEKTGYAVFTPTSGPEPVLRVALYASPKPVASMHSSTVAAGGTPGQFTVNLTGAPVNTGVTFPTDIIGLVKPFELQYVSSQIATPPSNPNILKYVGVTSDYNLRAHPVPGPADGTVVTFLLEGFGNASMPSYPSSDKEILIDVNNDGTYDYVVYLGPSPSSTSPNAYFPIVLNLTTGAAFTQFRTNGISPATRDTNAYNNSVVIVPVGVGNIGLAGGGQPTAIHYEVVTFDRQTNLQVDTTGPLVYNLPAPGLDVQGGNLDPFLYSDIAATTIGATYNGPNYIANASKGLLLAHMHNATGARTEVVNFQSYTASQTSLTYGNQVVNTTSSAQLVTMSNTGVVPITFTSITATAQFGATNNCTTLAPLATCTASVTFTPTAAGAATGTVTIASSAGNKSVSLSGTGINKLNQTITFGAAPTIAVSGTGSVNATATSFLPIAYSTLTPSTCTVNSGSGLVNGNVQGACTIAADQAGNATYNAAPQVTQTFPIGPPIAQTISFSAPANRPYPSPPFVVSASGGASGNPVTFASQTTGVCTTSGTNGTTVTIFAAGICRIAADQAGNLPYYSAATQVVQSFTVTGVFRAYLSKNGNDANPCTLPLPCRLLPAAMTVVSEPGEIWMLDSANFNVGTVAVFKSVTILAVPGALGSVVANGADAILVNSSSTIELALRNVVILNLSGAGNYGIRFLQGSQVTVEGSEIYGMQSGILVAALGGLLTVRDTTIRDTALQGVVLTGGVIGSLERATLINNGDVGIGLYDGAQAQVTGSTISGTTNGAYVFASGATTSRLALSATHLGGNGTGVAVVTTVGGATANAILEDATITHNSVGVQFNGPGTGVVYTRGNNALKFNTNDVSGGALTPQPAF